ncbi:hypothetical protein FB645_001749 [Coemansia sp. IMI 203386]|nr:hypothetical protein FB645_001749 [Coemansia sp. IMI 203386]
MLLDSTGRWPKDSVAYKVRVGVIMGVYAIYMVYAIVTFTMFISKSRDKHSGLAQRSIKLVTLQAIAGVLIGTVGMFSTALQLWPAFLRLWLTNIGYMIMYSSVISRGFQHIVISNLHNLTNELASNRNINFNTDINSKDVSSYVRQSLNQNRMRAGSQSSINSNTDFEGTDSHQGSIEKKKLSALVQKTAFTSNAYMPNGPERKLYKRLQKYARLQPYVSNKALFLYNLGVLVLAVIVSLIVNILNPQFKMSPMSMECRMYWGFIPLMAIVGSWIVFIMPLISIKCWKLKDAYGIRNDVLICMVMGVFCIVMNTIWDIVLPDVAKIWSGWFFSWISGVVLHTVSVTNPLLAAMRHSRDVTDRMHGANGIENSMVAAIAGVNGADMSKRSEYNSILADPHEYRVFCNFAASCFCSEMTAFIDEYQELKNITIHALGSEDIWHQNEDSHLETAYASRMANNVVKDSIGYLSMSNNAQNYQSRTLKLHTPPTVNILETAKAVYPQYDLSEITPFPVASMDKLIAIFSVFINSSSYTAVSLPSAMVMRLRDKLGQSQLTITILDEIKSEVLNMLYFDVYTRYIKTK